MGPILAASTPPPWTVLPFAILLGVIAAAPLAAGHFWEKNRHKLLVSILLSLPVAAFLLATGDGHRLAEGALEYAAFIALLGSLFVIAGGVHLRGSLASTPAANTMLLGFGAVIANLVGTTGASMLLIRPLLRANAKRERKTHLVVFFIFVVSNGGGLLTPLGDPPLFLGFLRGVPFLWTLGLIAPWAVVNGLLLLVFFVLDRAARRREAAPADADRAPLRIEGGLNLLWLLGVVGLNAGVGALRPGVREAVLIGGLAALAGLSLATTPRDVRAANRFTWGPILEVAAVFAGIFVTMIPATSLVEAAGQSGSLPLTQPWQFFWGSGLLSGVLDNAPTYVTFASLACGVVGAESQETLDPAHLDQLLRHARGALLLKAISCGSVFLGAATYIGNGPNFMVKAIAEEQQVKMPGFVGYLGWSAAVLIPVLAAATLLFFR